MGVLGMKNSWIGLGILVVAESLLVILMVMGMMALLSISRFVLTGVLALILLPLVSSYLLHRFPYMIDQSGFDLFTFDESIIRYTFAIPLFLIIVFFSWVTRSYIGISWGVVVLFVAFMMVGYGKKRHSSKTMFIHMLVSWMILTLPFIFIFEEI